MKNYFTRVKIFFLAHKVISVLVLLLLLWGGTWAYGKINSTAGETRYVLSPVTKGTLISSVTGSGQISALNQIDIKPNVSGALTYVGVQPGEKVGTGQLLFAIDDTSAQKAVRDAQVNLESAQIALNKLQLQDSAGNLNASLAKSYDDGFSSTVTTFLDLPGIISGLNDMFFTSTVTKNGQWTVDWYAEQAYTTDVDAALTYKQTFKDAYAAAQTAYNDNFQNYKSVSRSSDPATIEKLISQTYDDVKLISSAIKAANNYIDFVNASIKKVNNTPPAIVAANLSTLSDYTSKTNSHLQDLLSVETEIQSNKDAFQSSDLDTQSEQLSLQKSQNALQDAKDNLADYKIYAPFSGTVSSVPVQRGDNVGSGTVLGTIITAQQTATLSFNEVDIAKISLGQKATLTFDAVPGLSISGKVAQIDSVGTVTQGVVDYDVKITLDTYDARIKPGMSVSAAIITNVKQNVLAVPNSAVKTAQGESYVQMFDTPLAPPLPGVQGSPSSVPPREQPVTVGISNDTSTEIISGLNEGDEIITRTIAPTATASAAAPSILGSTGARGGAGAVRIPTGR